MSNGNSWSSCHFINRSGAYQGCYKAGTLSYSNDGTSMCFYTLPETYEGNRWYMEKKITRQLFFYENGLLLQSRLYPKGGDASGESYGDYRAVVQDIIAKCIEKSNLWKKVDDDWDCYIVTHNNTFHYCFAISLYHILKLLLFFWGHIILTNTFCISVLVQSSKTRIFLLCFTLPTDSNTESAALTADPINLHFT